MTDTLLGTYDSRLATAEAAYLRLISIDEAYCDALSSYVLRGAIQNPGRYLEALLSEHEVKATSNWRERQDSMTTFHGVRLTDCPVWGDVQTGTQIRNAVAHGLGTLTPRQRAKIRYHRESFAALDVQMAGIRVIVTFDAVLRCATYSKQFVAWLDDAVPD